MSKPTKESKDKMLPVSFTRAYAFLTIFIVPFAFYKPAIDVTLAPKLVYLTLVLLGVWTYLFFRPEIKIPVRKYIMPWPVLLWAGLFLISLASLLWAYNPYEGLFDLARILLSLIFLITTIFVLDHSRGFREFIIAGIAVGAVLSFVGFYQYFIYVFGESDLNVIYKVVGIWSHKNVFTGMLFMLIPLLVYGGFNRDRKLRLIAHVVLSAEVALILLLQTRSIWIALIVFILFSSTLYYVFRKRFQDSSRKAFGNRSRWFALSVGIGLMVAFVITRVSIGVYEKDDNTAVEVKGEKIASLEERAVSIFDTKTKNRQTRLTIWQYTWEMIREQPLTGVGAGNWHVLIGGYYDKEYMKSWYHNWRRPHNDLLLIWAENGILALLAFLGFLLSLLLLSVGFLRKKPASGRRLLVILAMGGIAGYIIDSLFAFPFERVDIQMMLMFYAAIIIRENIAIESSGKEQVAGNKWFPLAIVLLLIPCLYAGKQVVLGEVAANRAFGETGRGNPRAAIAAIDEGYTDFRQVDPSNNPLLWFRGRAYSILGQYRKAEEDLMKALEQMPYSVNAQTELGILYGRMGKHNKAVGALQRALELYPAHLEARYNLGVAYFELGNYEAALVHLRFFRDRNSNETVERIIKEAEKGLGRESRLERQRTNQP